MKLEDYRNNDAKIVKFGNPIFKNYTKEELNNKIGKLLELEIKNIEQRMEISSNGQAVKIMNCVVIYLDEHEVEKIMEVVE